MQKFREEARTIIYTDESYVDSSHSSSQAWSDGTTKGLKKPISKGQRIVIVHAGTETGFVPNALLTFKAGTKSGDYHDNMNYENYEKWLRTQLIPNIPPKSVLVVDNASYHNKQYDPAPSSNARKSEMLGWLREKGIQHEVRMLKPQLHHLIKINKDQYKKFNIDKIMAEHGHDVIRLPPYHPDLNPIEMAWAAIKGYVGSKNVTWNISHVTGLVKEKVNLMGANEWIKLCQKVKEIEKEYIKNDHIVDAMTEEFIIHVGDDDSETNSEDEDSDDVEEINEPVASTSTNAASSFMEGILPIPPD